MKSVLLQYFKYKHLPSHLQVVSKPFCELAIIVDSMDANDREKQVSLRKLLESKDAAVRSMLKDND